MRILKDYGCIDWYDVNIRLSLVVRALEEVGIAMSGRIQQSSNAVAFSGEECKEFIARALSMQQGVGSCPMM